MIENIVIKRNERGISEFFESYISAELHFNFYNPDEIVPDPIHAINVSSQLHSRYVSHWQLLILFQASYWANYVEGNYTKRLQPC